ncbi:hypothetical protein PORCRE_955 [Porphyromonas crevioricanis JCM 15906]|uniref:Uncharacterized protein n=1 Tax=Porphyromonas crevioricanis JCM 15906 TaxID=1305617 RepID=T1DRH6_9PORP|nr:hypothetical protein PORCRE_955 [Porphyromonas crevioricanis JCM 15906]
MTRIAEPTESLFIFSSEAHLSPLLVSHIKPQLCINPMIRGKNRIFGSFWE